MNADPAELAKFNSLAHRWWDPQGEFRPLHEINPLRLGWIDAHLGLGGKNVLDVGCGGGILAEAMAQRGARVTGIDLSDKALSVAQLHLLESRLPKGTHDYLRFVKPSELARWSRDSGLRPDELIGMTYSPISRQYRLGRDCDVNYLLRCLRDA